MNQNNHGQPRRNSTSFNRHNHGGSNHSGRSNHAQHGHQRWPSRYTKDYREYESCFNHGECMVGGGNSASPKDTNFMMNHGGYPKPPQLSPSSRQNHVMYSNEASGTQDWRHISHSSGPQDRRHMTGPGSSQQERRNTLVNGHVPERRHMSGLADRRHISPPLHINICDSAPTLHTLSPVGPQPEGLAHGRSTITIDYSQRRNGRGELRVSPVHLQHSPSYYRQTSSEDGIKSESPSRKRRRLSRSGHHQIMDMTTQSASPPHTHQHRRSPRQHQTSSNTIQGSPPLRRTRYRERNPLWNTDEFAHNHGHHPAFLPSPPPGSAHAHQSTVMMDMNQVYVSTYSYIRAV